MESSKHQMKHVVKAVGLPKFVKILITKPSSKRTQNEHRTELLKVDLNHSKDLVIGNGNLCGFSKNEITSSFT